MEENKLFDIDISKNERKTISTFIEIKKNVPKSEEKILASSKVTLVNRTLKEICERTNIKNKSKRGDKRKATDKGYQFAILNKLIEKGIVEKKQEGYSLKSKYLDVAHSSIIQNKIKELEQHGLFRFPPQINTVFGIKEQWMKYPESHHLHEAVTDIGEILYRIKQIKSIFLIRDFSKKWNDFIKLDIHDAVKYWLWRFIYTRVCSIPESKKTSVDDQIVILNTLDILSEGNKIDEYISKLKESYKDFLVDLKKICKYKKIKNPYLGDAITEKMNKYETDHSILILDYVINILNKKQRRMFVDILEWTIFIFPKEVNALSIYTDIGRLSGYPKSHFVLPMDNEEKKFRSLDKYDFFISRMKEPMKSLNVNTIDKSLKSLFDLYDERNHHRLYDRITSVFLKLIAEPDRVAFTSPKLGRIEKEIIRLAKVEKWKGLSLIKDGVFKSDNDIFNFIRIQHNPDLIDLLEEDINIIKHPEDVSK